MFGRQVTIRLKANSASELTRIADTEILPIMRKQKGFRDETTLISPERSEAIVSNFWDTKEDAEAYEVAAYREVLKILEKVIGEAPTVKNFEIARSTFRKTLPGRIA